MRSPRLPVLIAATVAVMTVGSSSFGLGDLRALAAPAAAPAASTVTGPLQNSVKSTYLGPGNGGWLDTAAVPTDVTYPAVGQTGPVTIAETCFPRSTSPSSGGPTYIAVGDGSDCITFRAEETGEGFFTFRVADAAAPADNRYLGDGNSGGALDLLSKTPLVLFAVPEAPAGTLSLGSKVADANGNGVTDAGDTVRWTATVANTGNVRLRDLVLALDPATPIVCDPATVGAGDAITCRSDPQTITQADMDAGSLAANVTATAKTPRGSVFDFAAASASVPLSGSVAVSGAITSDVPPVPVAGDEVTYTAMIRNTGSVSLGDVALVPSAGTLGTCSTAVLAPGGKRTCTISRILTQSDIDGGTLALTVQVRGSAPGGAVADIERLRHRDELPQRATADVSAVSDAPSSLEIGATVHYEATVANTGNTTLSDVAVVPSIGTASGCATATLAPGASTTCAIGYVVTSADADAGSVRQELTASASGPSGDTIALGSAIVSDDVRADPSVTATVTSDANTVPTVGDRIEYTVAVRNSGTVSLRDLELAPAATCATSTLAVGASTSCTVTGAKLTQADVDRGAIAFSATISGTTPQAGHSELATVRHSDTVPATLGADVVVTTDAGGSIVVGQTIVATTIVRNTGNVTISDLAVQGGAATARCADAVLAPNATTTCITRHEVTQADVDRGVVSTAVVVTGAAPRGTSTELGRAAHDDAIAAGPALAATISSDAARVPAVGDVVTWTITAKNSGAVTLHDLGAGDAMCATGPLAPGASASCTLRQTVTQAHVDAGSLRLATDISATTPAGATSVLATVDRSETIAPTATVDLSSTVDATEQPAVGDRVADTVRVRNTGTVTLHDLTLATDRGTVTTCDTTPLAPGASRNCVIELDVAQADVDSGTIAITGTVTGTTPGGVVTGFGETGATITIPAHPATVLAVRAEIGDGLAAGGDATIVAEVTNTGNVTLDALELVDRAAGSKPQSVECPSGPIAPGSNVSCTLHRIVLQDEVDAGVVRSEIGGTTRSPAGSSVEVAAARLDLPVAADPRGTVALTVEPGAGTAAGSEVVFTATVRNDGNVTMHDLVLSRLAKADTAKASTAKDSTAEDRPACDTTDLAPGASATCRYTRTLTQADVDAGGVTETVLASAAAPSGDALQFAPATAQIDIPASVDAATSVTADATADVHQGQVVRFRTRIVNTGTVTLHDVGAEDAQSRVAQQCSGASVAPGATVECIGERTISATDVAARRLHVEYKIWAITPDGARHVLPKASMELRTEEPKVLAFTGAEGVPTLIGLATALAAAGAFVLLVGRRFRTESTGRSGHAGRTGRTHRSSRGRHRGL